jgi:biopolymer transport protein ExbD
MNFRGKYRPDQPGFQIAPMIDVVFLLLCFFVTSQIFTQWEAEIDISLPTAKTSRIEPRLPGEIILNIGRTGEITVSGRKLTIDEVSGLLQKLASVYPGQPVLIRADRVTAYEHVIRILDICRQSDIWNISFATITMEETPAS